MPRKQEYNDDVCKLVQRRYEASKKYTQPYFDRFLDNYKHYFLRSIDEAIEADPQAYPFYSTLTIPISFQTVETLLPRVFSRIPTFTLSTDMENDEKAETSFRELIKYQMEHPYLIDDTVFMRLFRGAKELFITGNMWGEVPWVYKEAMVNEYQPYSMQLGLKPSWENLSILEKYELKPDWQLVKTKKKLIDAPVFQHRSVFHVFPEPNRKSAGELGWVVLEDFLTMEQIMDIVKVSPTKYQNIEVLKTMKPWSEGTTATGTNYDQEVAAIFGASDSSSENSETKLYKVLTMREPYKLVITINEKLTIRDTDNPNGDGKIGLFLCTDIPVPGQLYGWGEVDPIKKIEDAVTDQTNMRMDSVFYDLLRMWKLDPTKLLEGEEFYPEPGAIIQMNDLTGLQTVDTGSTAATAFKEYTEWDEIIQKTTGATDYATGQNDPGMTDTASGIEALQAAANARFAMRLQIFEQMCLKAMGTMYVQRNLVFFDDPQWVNTEDGKMLISPDQVRMIRGAIHFKVDTGSTEAGMQNKELQKWRFITDQIGANKAPFNNLTQESQDFVATRLLTSLGERNPEKIIIRNPAPAVPTVAGAMGGVVPPVAPAGQETAVDGAQPNAQPIAQPDESGAVQEQA